MRPVKVFLSLIALAATNGVAWAEACTYREAIMALEQGNALRGMALMRMASRDGDQRASQYLDEKDHVIAEAPVNDSLRQASIVSRPRQNF